MRLFLIINSRFRMPYLKGFSKSMEKAESISIIWDRFNVETEGGNVIVYRDGKYGMSRGMLDYLRFAFFVFFNAPKKVSSVVFFGPQAFIFCFPRFLFSKKWYLDVRDWHPALKLIPSLLLGKFDKIFVSSPLFFKGMKVDQEKIVLSHNCWQPPQSSSPPVASPLIRVAYIGSIRDVEINSQLISSLKNCAGVELLFYGDGDSEQDLRDMANSVGAKNVYFKGAYNLEDEDKIYQSSTIVNSLIPDSGKNNKYLLTNRLYNAARNYRPLLVIRGTYMASVVEQFGLGLVVNDFEEISCSLHDYFYRFQFSFFKQSCDHFLAKVQEDMAFFYGQVDCI